MKFRTLYTSVRLLTSPYSWLQAEKHRKSSSLKITYEAFWIGKAFGSCFITHQRPKWLGMKLKCGITNLRFYLTSWRKTFITWTSIGCVDPFRLSLWEFFFLLATNDVVRKKDARVIDVCVLVLGVPCLSFWRQMGVVWVLQKNDRRKCFIVRSCLIARIISQCGENNRTVHCRQTVN